jgi:hypothetical protein
MGRPKKRDDAIDRPARGIKAGPLPTEEWADWKKDLEVRRERTDRERLAREERETAEAERARPEAEARRAEAAEKDEAERAETSQVEAERAAAEQAERERAEVEQAEAARAKAAEKAEARAKARSEAEREAREAAEAAALAAAEALGIRLDPEMRAEAADGAEVRADVVDEHLVEAGKDSPEQAGIESQPEAEERTVEDQTELGLEQQLIEEERTERLDGAAADWSLSVEEAPAERRPADVALEELEERARSDAEMGSEGAEASGEPPALEEEAAAELREVEPLALQTDAELAEIADEAGREEVSKEPEAWVAGVAEDAVEEEADAELAEVAEEEVEAELPEVIDEVVEEETESELAEAVEEPVEEEIGLEPPVAGPEAAEAIGDVEEEPDETVDADAELTEVAEEAVEEKAEAALGEVPERRWKRSWWRSREPVEEATEVELAVLAEASVEEEADAALAQVIEEPAKDDAIEEPEAESEAELEPPVVETEAAEAIDDAEEEPEETIDAEAELAEVAEEAVEEEMVAELEEVAEEAVEEEADAALAEVIEEPAKDVAIEEPEAELTEVTEEAKSEAELEPAVAEAETETATEVEPLTDAESGRRFEEEELDTGGQVPDWEPAVRAHSRGLAPAWDSLDFAEDSSPGAPPSGTKATVSTEMPLFVLPEPLPLHQRLPLRLSMRLRRYAPWLGIGLALAAAGAWFLLS